MAVNFERANAHAIQAFNKPLTDLSAAQLRGAATDLKIPLGALLAIRQSALEKGAVAVENAGSKSTTLRTESKVTSNTFGARDVSNGALATRFAPSGELQKTGADLKAVINNNGTSALAERLFASVGPVLAAIVGKSFEELAPNTRVVASDVTKKHNSSFDVALGFQFTGPDKDLGSAVEKAQVAVNIDKKGKVTVLDGEDGEAVLRLGHLGAIPTNEHDKNVACIEFKRSNYSLTDARKVMSAFDLPTLRDAEALIGKCIQNGNEAMLVGEAGVTRMPFDTRECTQAFADAGWGQKEIDKARKGWDFLAGSTDKGVKEYLGLKIVNGYDSLLRQVDIKPPTKLPQWGRSNGAVENLVARSAFDTSRYSLPDARTVMKAKHFASLEEACVFIGKCINEGSEAKNLAPLGVTTSNLIDPHDCMAAFNDAKFPDSAVELAVERFGLRTRAEAREYLGLKVLEGEPSFLRMAGIKKMPTTSAYWNRDTDNDPKQKARDMDAFRASSFSQADAQAYAEKFMGGPNALHRAMELLGRALREHDTSVIDQASSAGISPSHFDTQDQLAAFDSAGFSKKDIKTALAKWDFIHNAQEAREYLGLKVLNRATYLLDEIGVSSTFTQNERNLDIAACDKIFLSAHVELYAAKKGWDVGDIKQDIGQRIREHDDISDLAKNGLFPKNSDFAFSTTPVSPDGGYLGEKGNDIGMVNVAVNARLGAMGTFLSERNEVAANAAAADATFGDLQLKHFAAENRMTLKATKEALGSALRVGADLDYLTSCGIQGITEASGDVPLRAIYVGMPKECDDGALKLIHKQLQSAQAAGDYEGGKGTARFEVAGTQFCMLFGGKQPKPGEAAQALDALLRGIAKQYPLLDVTVTGTSDQAKARGDRVESKDWWSTGPSRGVVLSGVEFGDL